MLLEQLLALGAADLVDAVQGLPPGCRTAPGVSAAVFSPMPGDARDVVRRCRLSARSGPVSAGEVHRSVPTAADRRSWTSVTPLVLLMMLTCSVWPTAERPVAGDYDCLAPPWPQPALANVARRSSLRIRPDQIHAPKGELSSGNRAIVRREGPAWACAGPCTPRTRWCRKVFSRESHATITVSGGTR